jgi:hypothetical protein
MTLVEQFPDASMFLRKKKKANLKSLDALRMKDADHTILSEDQKFYDKEFRVFHFKLASFIFILLAALFLLILNGQTLWNMIMS